MAGQHVSHSNVELMQSVYSDDEPKVSRDPEEVTQYLNVCEFREELERLGMG